MSGPFKVGDRVRVFGFESDPAWDGTVYCVGIRLGVRRDAEILVRSVHSKQCRRLVKKKRMEFWMSSIPSDQNMLIHVTTEPRDGYVHVREVKP